MPFSSIRTFRSSAVAASTSSADAPFVVVAPLTPRTFVANLFLEILEMTCSTDPVNITILAT
jgi:hypothetical protein